MCTCECERELQERLNQMWITAKKELEEAKSRLRGKEREREDLGEAEAVELKVRAFETQPYATYCSMHLCMWFEEWQDANL